MTTTDDWAWQKVLEIVPEQSLAGKFSERLAIRRTIAAALQEAIERGKAEQDKAVAAERERLLDRLRNPDHGLLARAVDAGCSAGVMPGLQFAVAREVVQALANTLTEGQEGESKDG